jgi:hypothetical protein
VRAVQQRRSQCTNELCAFSVVVVREGAEVDAMNKPERLRRATECTRLAEGTSDPEMKVYLMRLALSWMQSAMAEQQRVLEDA